MNKPHPAGPRAHRRALDKGALCLARRTKIPAGVRRKILGPVLDVLAASRGLQILPSGHQAGLTFGVFLARFGPLRA